jgi:hypothetical protein
MPAGHWVAFDPATDEPHVCHERINVKNTVKSTNSYSDIIPINDGDLEKWKETPEKNVINVKMLNDDVVRKLKHAKDNNLKVEIVYSGGSSPMTRTKQAF